MGICRLMLQAYRDYRDGIESELTMPNHYSKDNLIEGIDWAENDEEHTHFPHDDDIDYKGFIKWAKGDRT